MSDDAPTLIEVPRDTVWWPDGQDWAGALRERQIWVLGQLAEGGLEIARAIERQATAPEPAAGAADKAPPVVARGDIALAYARVARAVRQTLMLQSELIKELQALDRQAAAEARSARIDEDSRRPWRIKARRARVLGIVRRVAEADRDGREVERLARDGAERLEHDDIYGDVLTQPVSDLVARICRDLGLQPDWPRLAEEAWAQDEMRSGRPGAPLADLMAGGLDSPAPVLPRAPVPLRPPRPAPS